MNDELKALESQLSRLRPVAPSEFFEARMGAALETTKRARGGFAVVRIVAAAGFAAAVAWLAAFSPDVAAVRRPDVLRPVAAEEMLQSADDEGLMTLEDGSLARRVRLRFVETRSWSGAGKTLTWTMPREELRIVPVMSY